MSNKNVVCIVSILIGMAIGFGTMTVVYGNSPVIPKDRNITSYEYTTKCRCGGIIEGYQDSEHGINKEECGKCGYSAEFNE